MRGSVSGETLLREVTSARVSKDVFEATAWNEEGVGGVIITRLFACQDYQRRSLLKGETYEEKAKGRIN